MPRKPSASRPDPAGDGSSPDDLSPAFERLRAAAANLPGIEAGFSYGTPALKVGKQSFCRVKDPDTVVLMIDLEEKEMLMAAAPDVYFETDHYKGWPAFLVRVHNISLEELAHRLQRAWLRAAPKKLVKDWEARVGP
jgi:hypothetical protein